MAYQNKIISEKTTVSHDTDDAVGLPKTQNSAWFVAIVHHNSEKKIKTDLAAKGYEVYVAAQPRLRIYPSGRKKWIEAVVIHSKVFIHCSEQQRLRIINHPFIYRFMTNPSGAPVNGHRPLATIPDAEINALKFMLGQSDFPVYFSESDFQPGKNVKIIRGSLKGLEGEVIQAPGPEKDVVIHLRFLGSARVKIPVSDIQPIDNQDITPPQ